MLELIDTIVDNKKILNELKIGKKALKPQLYTLLIPPPRNITRWNKIKKS